MTLGEKIKKALACCLPLTEDEELKLSCEECPYHGNNACDISGGLYMNADLVEDIRTYVNENESKEQ